ncbi:MAG: hypothetical protein WBM99_15125 [Psychromonas sp.]
MNTLIANLKEAFTSLFGYPGDFGGCVVALLHVVLVEQVKTATAGQYQSTTGLKESIYLCQAKDGARHIMTIRN